MRIIIFIFLTVLSVFAQNTVTKVASNLGVVWGMTFLDENKLLISQKNGKIVLINLKTNEKLNIKNVPKVLYSGQGGLLDIQNKDGWIYFTCDH